MCNSAVNPYRRFVLLFAFALVALFSAAFAMQRFTSQTVEAEAAIGQTEAKVTAPPLTVTNAAVAFPSRLQLDFLWSTSLVQRFRGAFAASQQVTSGNQIVSYYGNPFAPSMGILGSADLETVGARLELHAALYDELNGPLGVVPALHLVYAVAQYQPTSNGLYLQYVPEADVQRYISYTREHDMLLFIDLQIGRSSVAAEVEKVLPYLRYSNVHLALDPEFAVSAPEIPGADLGSLSATDIDDAQEALEQLVEAEGLPPKLLIVHQFTDSMVQSADTIEHYPNVELIFDMDGYGPAAVKRAEYQDIASRPYATRAGIKLFFDHDPDLMSEADVLQLQPTPVLIIYQ